MKINFSFLFNNVSNFLKKKSFASDVAKIMGGTAFGQALGVITLPIITRLFAPDAFGLLGVYSAIVGILGVVVCMRYELTIVIPKVDNDAAHLYWVSIGFTLFWTSIALIAVMLYSVEIANLVNAPELAPFLWLVPIGVFIKGIHTSNSHWNTRRSKFGRLASVQISNSVVTSVSKIGAGLAGFTSGGYLIAGSLTGTFTASLELGRKIWKEDRNYLLNGITKVKLLNVIKEYKNISIFNTSASLFNFISTNAPLILLAYFFNPAIVGFYVLGHKILKVPVNLLGKSIQKVYFQRASDEYNKTNNLTHITETTGIKLSLMSIFFMTLMISTVAPLTPVIFGGEWIVAGQYMQWIALWIGITFISTPLRSINTILHQEDKVLYFQIFAFSLRIVALLIGGILLHDAYITVILYSVASFIYQYLFCWWIFSSVKASLLKVFSKIKLFILLSAINLLISIFFQTQNFHLGLIIVINFAYVILSLYMTKSYWKVIIK